MRAVAFHDHDIIATLHKSHLHDNYFSKSVLVSRRDSSSLDCEANVTQSIIHPLEVSLHLQWQRVL